MRVDAARNRDRILQVARELIARDGSSVAMDEIAAAAGVAVGTLYRHHPTKAALVDAVVRDSIEQMAAGVSAANERVRAGLPAGPELTDLFRAIARRHAVDDAAKEAATALGSTRSLLDGAREPEFVAGSAEHAAWAALQELLAAAIAERSVRADLTPLDLLAMLSGTPRPPMPDAVRDRYIEVVLAGIATPASPTGDRAGRRPRRRPAAS
ncbi:MAG: TetR family transcriptional regulator [Ilumatobacteraceae bacterium]